MRSTQGGGGAGGGAGGGGNKTPKKYGPLTHIEPPPTAVYRAPIAADQGSKDNKNKGGNLNLTKAERKEVRDQTKLRGQVSKMLDSMKSPPVLYRPMFHPQHEASVKLEPVLLASDLSLARALAYARQIDDPRTEAECRQDLAHALLGLGHAGPSRQNALAALALAEKLGFRDILQNCLYILGEVAVQEGDSEERDRWFSRLQTLFPDVPHLGEFLGLFDVSDLLTFH